MQEVEATRGDCCWVHNNFACPKSSELQLACVNRLLIILIFSYRTYIWSHLNSFGYTFPPSLESTSVCLSINFQRISHESYSASTHAHIKVFTLDQCVASWIFRPNQEERLNGSLLLQSLGGCHVVVSILLREYRSPTEKCCAFFVEQIYSHLVTFPGWFLICLCLTGRNEARRPCSALSHKTCAIALVYVRRKEESPLCFSPLCLGAGLHHDDGFIFILHIWNL